MYPELSAKHRARRLAPTGPGVPELIELQQEMANSQGSWREQAMDNHLQAERNQELRRMNRELEYLRRDLSRPYYDW
jgi:hypothetical protein